MPETRPLTDVEFEQLRSGRFPALRLDSDQWHECGYFYDPRCRHFAWYEIDRKDQVDATTVVGSAAAVLAGCEAERRAQVSAWIDAMPVEPCPRCAGYFGDWRSQGPTFPDEPFEILDHEEIEVGTHGAVTVMQGVARCRHCGLFTDFGCDYGPGYWFRAQPARG